MIKHTLPITKTALSFLLGIANAFSPLSYKAALDRPLIANFTGLLATLLATAAVLSLLSLPLMGKLSAVTLDVGANATAPVKVAMPWLGNLLINTTAGSTTDITITKNALSAQPAYCYLRSELCSILKPEQQRMPLSFRLTPVIILLLLPGIMLAIAAFLTARYILLIIPAAFLIYGISKLVKKDIGLTEAFKGAIHGGKALAILDVAAVLLGVPSLIAVGGYIALLGLALAFYDDER